MFEDYENNEEKNEGTTSSEYEVESNEGGINEESINKKTNSTIKYKNKYKIISIILALLLTISIGFTGGVLCERKFKDVINSASTKQIVGEANVNISASSEGKLTAKEVAGVTSSSVVEIATETMIRGSIMRQFIAQGAGSGVIVSSDGDIVTNYHVIEDASKITVTLKNGTDYEAKVVGSDEDNDIAIVKIDAKDLTPAIFGNSDELAVGEDVIAVGNPLGQLGGTVTEGIISALDREIDFGDTMMNLLQTDTAINPGNSGGGLFNMDGELIGITIAKSSGSDVEGLAFAIPINDVKTIIDNILHYGYVKGKIQVGMNLIDVSDVYTAMLYRVSVPGVYVQSVTANSSAETAGIQAGDRIIEFNDKNIDSMAKLKKAINENKVGDTVDIVVARDNKEKTLSLYLSEYVPNKY